MEIINIVLLSILFAVCMKIAHEISDGRLKLFAGAGLVFGVLYGYFAGVLINYDLHYLPNVWMAAMAGWILRSKINHFNIALGATIMFVLFVLKIDSFIFEKEIFLMFFGVMAVSGLLHDALYKKGVLSRKKSEFIHSVIFYTFLPLLFSLQTNNWTVFFSFFSFMVAYELTRKVTSYFEDNKHVSRKRTATGHVSHRIKRAVR